MDRDVDEKIGDLDFSIDELRANQPELKREFECHETVPGVKRAVVVALVRGINR